MNQQSSATKSPTQHKRERNWCGHRADNRPQQNTQDSISVDRAARGEASYQLHNRTMPNLRTQSNPLPTNMLSVTTEPTRSSTPGRRRSEASHQAILKAASELLEEVGYVGMSIEAIARRAGVGKQTIYRWWPSKGHVVLEFYGSLVQNSLSDPDTGSVQTDLVQWVEQLVALLTTSASTQALAGILAEMQANPALAQKFSCQIIHHRRRCIHAILQRGVQRGELRDDLNIELAADLIDAPTWYRLLIQPQAIDRKWAEQLIDEVFLGLQAFEEEV